VTRPSAAFSTVACLHHFEEVLGELLGALRESGLAQSLDTLSLAVLGAPDDRRRVRALVAGFPRARIAHESDDLGEFEYPALGLLQAHCADHDGAVLYFHTKGVSHGPTDQFVKHWRRLMTHHVIERHPECLAALGDHDCSGTNWRETHFSGNFWWANARYVRRLPSIEGLRRAPLPLSPDPRWNARLQCEFWIGMGQPCHPANFGPRGQVLYDRVAWCMSRTEVLNALVEHHGLSRYLEVGLHDPSHNFDAVRATLKHSVDPSAPATFRLASDAFFALLHPEVRYDLIFIDGHHEEEQVLRDLGHALAHLAPGGAVVLHDSSPPSRWHQRPAAEFQPGTEWNGTVWRAVVRFRCAHPDVLVYTVDTDWGCTVIRPSEPEPRPLDGVAPEELRWERFERERERWLNLISVGEFRRRVRRRGPARRGSPAEGPSLGRT
jgi:hypothetical protein